MQKRLLLTVCKKQSHCPAQQFRHGYLCSIMALIDLIFVIFVLYLLYKLVFGLILPVSKAASSVRDQVRNMQNGATVNQSRDHSYNQQSPNNPASQKNNASAKDSDYIDFEEVK